MIWGGTANSKKEFAEHNLTLTRNKETEFPGSRPFAIWAISWTKPPLESMSHCEIKKLNSRTFDQESKTKKGLILYLASWVFVSQKIKHTFRCHWDPERSGGAQDDTRRPSWIIHALPGHDPNVVGSCGG